MREYFNRAELEAHIVLLGMGVTLKNMVESTAITQEEKRFLKTALTNLTKFSDSVFNRFGLAYRKKMQRTCESNRIEMVGKYEQVNKAVEDVTADDLLENLKQVRSLQCFTCTKKDHLKCGLYNLFVSGGLEGHNDNGCPYADGIDDLDEVGEQ